MELFQKDGFDFSYFIDVYNNLNHPNDINTLSQDLKDKIILLYKSYYKDYKSFIKNIVILLGIKKEHIEYYLKNEYFCICCKKKYPIMEYPFIDVYFNKYYITYNFCHTCINKISNNRCRGCCKKFENNKDISKIYINNINNYLCTQCYESKIKIKNI
jgi:hypothetical protein